MSTVAISARVDESSKKQAKSVLEKLGLSMSGAIELFFRQVVIHQGIPFDIRLPSTGTAQAIDELEAGKGTKFESVDDLFEDLDN
jgi:DNA-damage-inducible protein J